MSGYRNVTKMELHRGVKTRRMQDNELRERHPVRVVGPLVPELHGSRHPVGMY